MAIFQNVRSGPKSTTRRSMSIPELAELAAREADIELWCSMDPDSEREFETELRTEVPYPTSITGTSSKAAGYGVEELADKKFQSVSKDRSGSVQSADWVRVSKD